MNRFVIGDNNIALFEIVDMEEEELLCECRAVDVEKVVELLNFLYEENKELKKRFENGGRSICDEVIDDE